ncbi:MAG: type II toxin-antitoxin system VapC family toxin, partial [Polyangiaceae bacterium]
MTSYQIDSDVLIYATSVAGPERRRLLALADSTATLSISAVAWYEYARGPRLPDQLALARRLLEEMGAWCPWMTSWPAGRPRCFGSSALRDG